MRRALPARRPVVAMCVLVMAVMAAHGGEARLDPDPAAGGRLLLVWPAPGPRDA